MNKKTTIDGPIYDARQLGTPKMLLLGLQHMFAMFGATVLVPALTGLDVATALLFAGIGTLLFHLLTGRPTGAYACEYQNRRNRGCPYVYFERRRRGHAEFRPLSAVRKRTILT